MKMKHASFLDLYLEKIILAVVVVLSIIILLYYSFGSPFTVSFDTRGNLKMPPSEAAQQLRMRAMQLESGLNNSEDNTIPEIAIDYVQSLQQSLKLRVADSSRILPWDIPGLPFIDIDVTPVIPKYISPVPNSPEKPVTVVSNFVLGDGISGQVEQAVRRLIGPADPPDFFAVRVVSDWDAQAWSKMMATPATDLQAIPESWRDQTAGYLVDVILERQEIGPDGSPVGDVITLAPLPTNQMQITLREMNRKINLDQGTQLEQMIKQSQSRIRKPMMLPTKRGTFEGSVALNEAEKKRLAEITKELEDVERTISNLQKQLGVEDTREFRRPDDRFNDGPPPEDDPRMNPTANPREEMLRKQLQDRIQQKNQLEIERERIMEAARERAGNDSAGGNERDPRTERPFRDEGDPRFERPFRDNRFEDGPPPDFDPDRGERDDPRLNNGQVAAGKSLGEIKHPIWRYDVTARPGKTYRYRMRVAVLNPFFNRHALLHKDQKDLADSVKIVGQPSNWSEPTTIPLMKHYFVMRASSGRAEVEVWRISDGIWQNHKFTVMPGQRIGQIIDKVDYRTGAILVDILPGQRGASTALVLETGGEKLSNRDPGKESRDPLRNDILRERNEQLRRASDALSSRER